MATQQETASQGRDLPPGQVTDPNMSAENARQGVTGFGVRHVLAFSLGGALVALAIAWLVIAI